MSHRPIPLRLRPGLGHRHGMDAHPALPLGRAVPGPGHRAARREALATARRRRPSWRLGLLGVALLVGCGGEIEVERLVVRPSLEDYQSDIHPMLVAMQCGAAPCHGTTFVGEVRITVEPDGETLYRDYQSLKAVSNPREPERSVLVARLLEGAAGANHFPLCFKSRQDCTYRKLVAWIGWDGEGPRPSEIDCDPAGETCFR